MITASVGKSIINCFDGKYDRYQLKQWSAKKILKCPACGDLYEYCHGEVIQPYFRHVSKDCGGNYSESESEEHIKGKIALYNWIKKQEGVTDCELEKWIPETKQRPDIYFIKDNKEYVIEFQCTPIASEYLERRELYKLANIQDIWILGTEKYNHSSNRVRTIDSAGLILDVNTSIITLSFSDTSNELNSRQEGIDEWTWDRKILSKLRREVPLKTFKNQDYYANHLNMFYFSDRMEIVNKEKIFLLVSESIKKTIKEQEESDAILEKEKRKKEEVLNKVTKITGDDNPVYRGKTFYYNYKIEFRYNDEIYALFAKSSYIDLCKVVKNRYVNIKQHDIKDHKTTVEAISILLMGLIQEE